MADRVEKRLARDLLTSIRFHGGLPKVKIIVTHEDVEIAHDLMPESIEALEKILEVINAYP